VDSNSARKRRRILRTIILRERGYAEGSHMSNPSGDALMAVGIKDTQEFSRGAIRRAVADDRRKRASIWSDAHQIALGIAVGAFVVVFLVL
jgi:hypothetical protein